MRTRVLLFSVPLIGLLCSAADGRAGMINWTADWSQSSALVAANGGAMSGGVSLSTPAVTVMSGNATVTAADLTTFTAATSANPDLFNAAPYSLKVDITDQASGKSGMLTFTGSLSGSQTTNSATFTNVYNSPISQMVQIGSNDYTVSLTSFLAPGPAPVPAGTPIIGKFTAQIAVQPATVGGGGGTVGGGGGTPLATPEPASLVLAGLGISAFGLFRWRRSPGLAAG